MKTTLDDYKEESEKAYMLSMLAYVDLDCIIRENPSSRYSFNVDPEKDAGRMVRYDSLKNKERSYYIRGNTVVKGLDAYREEQLTYKNKMHSRELSYKELSHSLNMRKGITLGELFSKNAEYIGNDNVEQYKGVKEILSKHPEWKNIRLVNIGSATKGLTKNTLEGFTFIDETKEPHDTYITFRGTAGWQWMDDGEGLYKPYSEMQIAAKKYYEFAVRDFGGDGGVFTCGHSKGGNLAQIAPLGKMHQNRFTAAFSFDGQGASQEFVDLYEEQINKGEVCDQRDKIFSICHENDFVNGLGRPLASAENTYFLKDNKIGGPITHYVEKLMNRSGDGVLNYAYNSEGKIEHGEVGAIGKAIRTLSYDLMKMGKVKKRACARYVMAIAQGIFGNDMGVLGKKIKLSVSHDYTAVHMREGGGTLKRAGLADLNIFWHYGVDLICNAISKTGYDEIRDTLKSLLPEGSEQKNSLITAICEFQENNADSINRFFAKPNNKHINKFCPAMLKLGLFAFEKNRPEIGTIATCVGLAYGIPVIRDIALGVTNPLLHTSSFRNGVIKSFINEHKDEAEKILLEEEKQPLEALINYTASENIDINKTDYRLMCFLYSGIDMIDKPGHYSSNSFDLTESDREAIKKIKEQLKSLMNKYKNEHGDER